MRLSRSHAVDVHASRPASSADARQAKTIASAQAGDDRASAEAKRRVAELEAEIAALREQLQRADVSPPRSVSVQACSC